MNLKLSILVIVIFVAGALGSYFLFERLGTSDGTGNLCGNGVCDGNESTSCPQDCGLAVASPLASPTPRAGARCGDGICNAGENSKNCHQDCPTGGGTPGPKGGGSGGGGFCGDNICQVGENIKCPTDCAHVIVSPSAVPSPVPSTPFIQPSIVPSPVPTPSPQPSTPSQPSPSPFPTPTPTPTPTPPPPSPTPTPTPQQPSINISPTSVPCGNQAYCFNEWVALPSSIAWTSSEILVANVNASGGKDVLIVRPGSPRTLEAWQYGGSAFTRLFTLPFGSFGLAAVGDLDANGRPEIIAGLRSGNSIQYKCYEVSQNLESLVEKCSVTLKETSALAVVKPFGLIANVDEDGAQELILVGIPSGVAGSSGVTIYSMSGGSLTEEDHYAVSNGGVGSFGAIDADGDGTREIILPIAGGSGAIEILESQSANSYNLVTQLGFPESQVYQVVTGAFTSASERQFIALGRNGSGNSYTRKLYDYSAGSYQTLADAGNSGRTVTLGALMASGDMNGDGTSESPFLISVEEECCPNQDHMPTSTFFPPDYFEKNWDYHSLTNNSTVGPHFMADVDGDGRAEIIQGHNPLSGGGSEIIILHHQ